MGNDDLCQFQSVTPGLLYPLIGASTFQIIIPIFKESPAWGAVPWAEGVGPLNHNCLQNIGNLAKFLLAVEKNSFSSYEISKLLNEEKEITTQACLLFYLTTTAFFRGSIKTL